MAVPVIRLVADPVLPDVATADELAPLLDSETAVPDDEASPVGPELPVFPDWVWTSVVFVVCCAAGCAADAAGGAVVVVTGSASAAGPKSTMAAAAMPVAPARHAAPATRTLLFPLVVMLIPCLGSAFEQVPERRADVSPRHKVVRFLARGRGWSKLCRPKFLGEFR
jgi:hypothetical protein